MYLTIEDIDSDPNEYFLIEEVFHNNYTELRTKEEVIEIVSTPELSNASFRWFSMINNHEVYSYILEFNQWNYDYINELCEKFNCDFNLNSRYFVFINLDKENDQIYNIKEIKDIHNNPVKFEDNLSILKNIKKIYTDSVNLDNKMHMMVQKDLN
jgi:hypothetical protein